MSATKPTDTLHLERRHLTWFCVKYVPIPLRPTLGKKLSRTLTTHDLGEARKLRHAVLVEFNATIAAAEATLAGRGNSGTTPGNRMAEAMADRAVLTLDEDGGIADTAQAIEDRHGAEAAQAYFRVASGRSTPITHHVEGWLGEAQYPPRSKVQHRGTLAELRRWCAAECVSGDVEAVTRQVAGKFIAGALAAKSARTTVNRKLSTFRAYWGWLVARGHTQVDPWADQSLPKGRLAQTDEEENVRDYTDAELLRLLNGGADAVLADFIRVAALTGARIESLAKLQVRDCQGGVFHIRRDKTPSGTRSFPIHSGLAGLVAERCKGKAMGDWLFHECSTTSTGSRAAAVSQRFGRYRQKLGIHDEVEGRRGSRVNFHSIRHWFVTAAIRAGQHDGVVGQVVGHKPQGTSTTRKVYHHGALMDQLRACVEAVKLPASAPTTTA